MENENTTVSCHCSNCGDREISIRACRSHLAKDEVTLRQLKGSSSEEYLQLCINRTKQSLLRKSPRHVASDPPAPMHRIEEGSISTIPLTGAEYLQTAEANTSTATTVPTQAIAPILDDNTETSKPQSDWTYERESFSDVESDVVQGLSDREGDEEDNNAEPTFDGPEIAPMFELPGCIQEIKQSLLGDYTRPEKPGTPFAPQPLTESQKLSLQHYIAWRNSNGTVRAYNEHRSVLEAAADEQVLSLYRVRALAQRIARVQPRKVDMCTNSCIAYTGEYAHLTSCPYIRSGTKSACGEARYKTSEHGLENPKKPTPRAQVTILPILPSIQALFANAESSRLLRSRDKLLQEVLKMLGEPSTSQKRYSDFANGYIHQVHRQAMGLFEGERDIALAMSSDGAQLTLKKQSSTWISILILLNLPAEIRYHSANTIINFAIPGPNAPGDVESFLRPMFEELATGSEGIWIWDALDSAWFLIYIWLVALLGDMLGSAKVNGMSGHTAIHGDRFSPIQGARTSLQQRSKSQYYPLNPPDTVPPEYNPGRPVYKAAEIPIRSQEEYWGILDKLSKAKTKAEAAKISKSTGVARIPLAAASPAFVHPAFFPLDPFHLFYENCMPWLWDIWSGEAKAPEAVAISASKLEKLGQFVAAGMRTLPPSFCGAVRDPYLKRQSQYKAFEWMALLHWYLLPIGIELEFNGRLLKNLSLFVYVVEQAMTVRSWSEDELASLRETINEFLEQFELLYVGSDPEKIHRCRLCLFQLIHVPMHIKWFGSIRVGSQAPVERAIGEAAHKIHSKKNPFANLSNIIVEKEVVRIVQLFYPDLSETTPFASKTHPQARVFQRLRFGKVQAASQIGKGHMNAIRRMLGIPDTANLLEPQYNLQCYGKLKLENGQTLRSQFSEALAATNGRCYRWFETATSAESFELAFGEALAFYCITARPAASSTDVRSTTVVVMKPLTQVEVCFKTVIRGRWPGLGTSDFVAIDVSKIRDVIGIWEAPSKNIYALRKHPALLSLSHSERGLVDEIDREGGEDDFE